MTAHKGEFRVGATHVVELTPVGRGAVAVVLVAGQQAIHAVQQYFVANSRRLLSSAPLNRIFVGYWGSSDGEELIVVRRSEDRVEVHCHGGVAAVRAVIADLIAQNCEEISWQEWVRRTPAPLYLRVTDSSVDDAVTRAAHIALADAITTRTAAILVDQLNGALSRSIQDTVGAVEKSDWQEALRMASKLSSNSELGRHLTMPWRVVLAGPPNVGKSSLMNALAGFQRAIVTPTPGTTRDVVTLTTAIEGWPVELADTAGLRATSDELESAGVQLAQQMLATADVVLRVHDATCNRPEPSGVEELYLPPVPAVARRPVIDVWNKADLLSSATVVQRRATANDSGAAACPGVFTSAVTGQGIAELTAAIGAALVPHPPAADEAVPFTQSQIEAITVARNAIERRHASAALEALQSVLANA